MSNTTGSVFRPANFIFAAVAVIFVIIHPKESTASHLPSGDVRKQAYALIQAARSAREASESDRALQLYNEALELATRSNDQLLAASINLLIGEVFEEKQFYQRALQRYEYGLLWLNRQRPPGDGDFLGEALRNLQVMEKGFTPDRGTPVSTDLFRAEINDLEALLAQKKSQARQQLAIMLMINTGNMYLQQFQFAVADSLYHQAAHAAHRMPSRFYLQHVWSNLAWSALKNKRFEQASAWLDSVSATPIDSADLVELRRPRLAVGVQLREQGQYAQAITALEKALDLYERANDHRGRCRALAHLGTAHLQAGELEKAKASYLSALECNENVDDRETSWHSHGGLAKCYQLQAELELAVQHYEAYLNTIESMASGWGTDQGKVGLLENHNQIFSDYVRLSLQVAERNNDFAIARTAVERGRSRNLQSLQIERQKQSRKVAGHLDAGLFFFKEQWPHVERELALGVESGLNVQQTTINVPSSPQMNKLVLGIPSPSSIPQAEEAARTDTSAIPPVTFLEYFVFNNEIAIFVKTPEGEVHGTIVEVSEDSLAALIAEYGHALEVQDLRGISYDRQALPIAASKPERKARKELTISRELHRLLVAPISSYLPNDSKQNVVIVPHRVLWTLPFAALRDSSGEFFGEQHVLTYAASEGSWRLIASRVRQHDHRQARAWIAGNPRMPAHAVSVCGLSFAMSPLTGAEEEAREIYRMFGSQRAQLFLGNQADRLRLDAWHPDYNVLHLATHGFACVDDPLSSFVVLAGLGADELRLDEGSEVLLSKLDARLPVTLDSLKRIVASPFRPPLPPLQYPGLLEARTIITHFALDADLVTLSACQTGLGQLSSGEGMIGLSRAFLAAGARSLLVSLWRVDDQATKELMVGFYREYLKHGNKGLALQSAMRQIRKRFPAPRYWAAFSLYGMAE